MRSSSLLPLLLLVLLFLLPPVLPASFPRTASDV